ncbi:MAG: alginate export family protein [Candidatus Omnitrophota bacterium]
MKKLIVAMAVLSFAFAGASFAAVDNIKISGDISTEAVARDLTLGNKPLNNQDPDSDQFLFSQIRIRFDADLTEGVSAVVRILNERIWGGATSGTIGDSENAQGDSDMTLDLGYVALKEFMYDPLTLVVGRQELRYGNALIIGDVDTNRRASNSKVPVALRDLTLRKSFDAVRGILDYAPWTVDLIFAKVEEATTDQDDDVTLIGTNAAYDWSSYNGVTELYLLYVDKAPGFVPAVNNPESRIYVIGGRAQADLSDKLTLGLEGAYQFGKYNVALNQDRQLRAYATQAIAEYRLLDAKNTKLGVNYTYLSGDNSQETGSAFNGWDPLFEDQSPGEVINILFNNTNMQYLKASVSTMPREDITLGLNYVFAALATDNTAATLATANSSASASGTIRLNAGANNNKAIGNEVDVYGIYDYTEDVQLSLTGGWFMPGKIFMDDNIGYSIRGGITVGF